MFLFLLIVYIALNIFISNIYFFVTSFFLMFVTTLVYIRLLICKIKIKISNEEVIPIKADGSLPVTITLSNRGILPEHIKVVLALDEATFIPHIRIAPRSYKQLEFEQKPCKTIVCGYGYVLFSPLYIPNFLLIGFFMYKVKYIIIPTEYSLEQKQRFWAVVENETGNKFTTKNYDEAPVDIAGYRKFRQGDRLKDIAVNISLKKDELYVKEFFYPEKCRHYVILEFYKKKNKKLFVMKDKNFINQFWTIAYNTIDLLMKKYGEVTVVFNKKNGREQARVTNTKEMNKTIFDVNKNLKYNMKESNIENFGFSNRGGNNRVYVVSQKDVSETQKLMCSIKDSDMMFYQIPFESECPERFRG